MDKLGHADTAPAPPLLRLIVVVDVVRDLALDDLETPFLTGVLRPFLATELATTRRASDGEACPRTVQKRPRTMQKTDTTAAADTAADVIANLGSATAVAAEPTANRAATALITSILAGAGTTGDLHARGDRPGSHWRARIDKDLGDVCIKLHIVSNMLVDHEPSLRQCMRIPNPASLGAASTVVTLRLAAAAATTSAVSIVAITSIRATAIAATAAIASETAACRAATTTAATAAAVANDIAIAADAAAVATTAAATAAATGASVTTDGVAAIVAAFIVVAMVHSVTPLELSLAAVAATAPTIKLHIKLPPPPPLPRPQPPMPPPTPLPLRPPLPTPPLLLPTSPSVTLT